MKIQRWGHTRNVGSYKTNIEHEPNNHEPWTYIREFEMVSKT